MTIYLNGKLKSQIENSVQDQRVPFVKTIPNLLHFTRVKIVESPETLHGKMVSTFSFSDFSVWNFGLYLSTRSVNFENYQVGETKTKLLLLSCRNFRI